MKELVACCVALIAGLSLVACEEAPPAPAAPTPAASVPAAPAPAAEAPPTPAPPTPAPPTSAPVEAAPAAEAAPAKGGGLLPDPDFSLKTPSLELPNQGGKNILGEEKKEPRLLDSDLKGGE